LYDKLYRSEDFRDVSVEHYLSPLIDEIIRNFPNCGIVTLDNRIVDFMLDVRRTSSIGIIINELLTNIMKHAFVGKESGIIDITASEKGKHVIITVADDGVGLPDSVTFENTIGFGLQLVQMLAEQIRGKIRIERGKGTKFLLEFAV
jgi:two-component sensor histidine kinase